MPSDVHCHHKIPKCNGGTDAYGNLTLVSKPVHKLIHAVQPDIIRKYCNILSITSEQLKKVNILRQMAGVYEINTADLSVLNLSSSEYTILHWLALLMKYRKFRVSTPVMKRGADWLKEHFLIDLTPYDAVIGYRADDSYFSFARAFVNNEISLTQLSYAMRLGKLGEQFVLKSPAAFEKIEFISYEIADNTEYYAKRKARDDEARAAFRAELEKDDLDGLYMRDIIREEVQADDPRLR